MDTDDVDEAVHLLHRFSLLTVDETTDTIRMHGLLQRAVRDATHPDHRSDLANAAADALVEIWPEVERDAAHAQALRANTTALHTTTDGQLWTTTGGGHPVLFLAGRSLGDTGLVAAAADHFQHLHTQADQRLGPDHPRHPDHPPQPRLLAGAGRGCGRGGHRVGAAARRLPAGARPGPPRHPDHPPQPRLLAGAGRRRGRPHQRCVAVPRVRSRTRYNRIRASTGPHPGRPVSARRTILLVSCPGEPCTVRLRLHLILHCPDSLRVPLVDAWAVPFEAMVRARRFTPRKGQRHLPGRWWSATDDGHVGYESWLERDHLMWLDFDATVVGIASQPFRLSWTAAEGRIRSHVPDYFARRTDGSAVVVDCRPVDRRPVQDVAAFEATRQAGDLLGWEYRLVGAVDVITTANLRWLAGYRHPRHGVAGLMEALRAASAAPTPLMAGAEAVGDPIAVLPVLFHLLWRHDLTTDLSVPLHPDATVTSVAAA